MTNYALAIYRHETRDALDLQLGRASTNAEHNAFLRRVAMNYHDWLRELARKEQFDIERKEIQGGE